MIKTLVSRVKNQYNDTYRSKALLQLYIQMTLILLLLVTIFLVCFTQSGKGRETYILMMSAMALSIVLALVFNLFGKYNIMTFLTVVVMVSGPWVSTTLNHSIAGCDFIPFVYITIPIPLCAIFLSEITTVIIAVLQLFVLIAVIVTNPNFLTVNWPSLVSYVFFASTLGIVTSIVMKRQVTVIEQQRRRLQKDEQDMRTLSEIDELTGLYNRRFMNEAFTREMEASVQQGIGMGVMMLDIDHFKVINDTYGHAAGDSILKQMAGILSADVREHDILCRYGGDEFIILLPDCSEKQAQAIANRLCEDIAGSDFIYEEIKISVTASIGVAIVPGHGNNQTEVFRAADRALYLSKTQGRNKVTIA